MRVLYFAWMRERVGVPEESVEPPPTIATVADLAAWLAGRSEGHALAFARPEAVRCALDKRHARPEEPLGDAREAAFFPPMTGG